MEPTLEPIKSISRPTGQPWESPAELHDIVWGAVSTVAWLGGMEPAMDHPEVKETLEALGPQLDAALSNRDAGGILDNQALCAIACDSAHLLAALLDPMEGMGLAALPQGAQEAAKALLGKLWRIGLMDCYMTGGGQFGIWGSV